MPAGTRTSSNAGSPAGTYYIRVDAYGSGTIGYQLPLPCGGCEWSSGGTRETALNLGNLTSVSGFRSRRGTVNRTSNDTDYFRFTLSAARTVRIELRGLSGRCGSVSGECIRFPARELGPRWHGRRCSRTKALFGYLLHSCRCLWTAGTIGYQLRYRAAGGWRLPRERARHRVEPRQPDERVGVSFPPRHGERCQQRSRLLPVYPVRRAHDALRAARS